MIENSEKEKDMHKDLGDDKREILLDNNKCILKPV